MSATIEWYMLVQIEVQIRHFGTYISTAHLGMKVRFYITQNLIVTYMYMYTCVYNQLFIIMHLKIPFSVYK